MEKKTVTIANILLPSYARKVSHSPPVRPNFTNLTPFDDPRLAFTIPTTPINYHLVAVKIVFALLDDD